MSDSEVGSLPSTVEIQLGHPGSRGGKDDSFFDGRLTVNSRDGLPGEEKSLLQVFPKGRSGKALFLGDGSIVPAIAYKLLNPGATVTIHQEDHWAHSVAMADLESIPEALRPTLHLGPEPEGEGYEAVAVAIGKSGMTDLLRETFRGAANRLLKKSGLFYCGYYGESESFIRREIEKAFGSVTTNKTARRHSFGFVARRPDAPLVNEPTGWATFTIKEGDEVLQLRGRVGVFCHDRLDNGTRALLATAAIDGARSVCDIGCGVGVVSVAAAKRCPEAHLTCIDSSARAIQSTEANLIAHGLRDRARIILNSNPVEALEGIDKHEVMLANPPYYGNWRIAEAFVAAAVIGLVPGGRLFLVTKGPNWYRDNCPPELVLVDIHLRGGYSILEFEHQ